MKSEQFTIWVTKGTVPCLPYTTLMIQYHSNPELTTKPSIACLKLWIDPVPVSCSCYGWVHTQLGACLDAALMTPSNIPMTA